MNYIDNLFENSLIYTGLYKEIVPYLTSKDLIHLSIINTYIYNDKFIEKYLNKKSLNIIKLFKKYHILNSFIQNEFDELNTIYFKTTRRFIECSLARKYQAMLYYSFYNKRYRKNWYNNQIGWKKEIVDFHKKKYTDNPTKYDLFILIKSMSVTESISIGW
jgi:hypothetical protein